MNNWGWKYTKICDCAEVIGGGTPSTKKSEYWNGKIPWISPKDLSKNLSKYITSGARYITQEGLENSSAKILPPNSLIFSSRAPIGYLAINKKSITTNQGFKSLILKKGYDVEFFYYLFKDKIEYIKSHSSGSTFQEISGSVIKELSFLIPDIKEQKNISNILLKLDKKIELNQKINETLEEIATSTFNSWFINFDPVKAKAEGRYDSISKEFINLFPNSFYKTELGEIPEGWTLSSISDVLKIQGGFAFKSKDFGKEGYSIIKIKNIKEDGTVNILECDKVKNIDKKLDSFLLNDGDAIIAMTGATIGKVGLLSVENEKIYLNQRVGRLKSKISKKQCWYSVLLLRSKNIKEKIESIAYGSAQPNISSKDIESIPNVTPPPKLLEVFNNLMSPLFEKILLNFKENKNLIILRDILIPVLVSGKLNVTQKYKDTETN